MSINPESKAHSARNRIVPYIEAAVIKMAIEQPDYGQLKTANILKRKSIHISPAGVRAVWFRHGLETFDKRVIALKAKIKEEGLIPTDVQREIIEKYLQEKNKGIKKIA